MASNNPDLITYISLKRTLVLNTTDPDIVIPSELLSHFVIIEATDQTGNPVDIFVYQRETIYPQEASFNGDRALFTNICSPNDYQELPAGIPTDPDVLLFRYNQIKAIARSMTEADYIWAEVKNDVAALIKQHKLLNALTGDVTIEIIH